MPKVTFPAGPWQSLLTKAYALIDAVSAKGTAAPRWSLGGGTVLMFYYGHRLSKDIDIFVPDPQFLGYVNPRLSDAAEAMTTEYTDSSGFVKLFLDEGEIDFVATLPLTTNPFEEHEVLGRKIWLESPVEIVAKKIWHRGDRATARDLLDLACVIDKHEDAILKHKEVFSKNIDVFVEQCKARRAILMPAFNQIELLEFKSSYDECLERVEGLRSRLR